MVNLQAWVNTIFHCRRIFTLHFLVELSKLVHVSAGALINWMISTSDRPKTKKWNNKNENITTIVNDKNCSSIFELFNYRTPRDPLRGSNASSEPLLEMGTKSWEYEALSSDLHTPVAITPSSTPPKDPLKIHCSPRVCFEPENLENTRRRSSARRASTSRRRSRSMSAWSDLSRCSFRLDER